MGQARGGGVQVARESTVVGHVTERWALTSLTPAGRILSKTGPVKDYSTRAYVYKASRQVRITLDVRVGRNQ